MPRLNPTTTNTLRWSLFLPAVVAIALAGLIATVVLLEISEDRWLAFHVMALGTGAAVYFGSMVAPSARRWPTFVAAVMLVAVLLFLRSLTADADTEARGLLVTGVAGVVAGALIAVRRIRIAPVAARSSQGKASRYKGTAPFQHTPVDRNTFFGRERETRSLLSLVLAERLVVVFGKSGMGKSSLINAGLVEPLLERGYLPVTVRLSDQERGPLASLLDGVRAAARTAGVEIAGGDESTLGTFFRTAEFWSAEDDLLQPVLILDQFEELFTLHAPALRPPFVAQLAELLRGPGLDAGGARLKIVLSLREDFLADLEELAQDIPGILQHRFRVGPFTAENARDAIVKPAALEDPSFETPPFGYSEEALQRILTFLARRRRGDETVQGEDIEPAQLQLVCQYVEEMVRTRLARRGTTRSVVSEADRGGEPQLQRGLEEFYDHTLASIDPRERHRVRRLCEQRLISSAGRRLTEAEEEIEKKHRVSKRVLRQLVDTRLLRPEPRLGGVFYELSHDTLVEPIRRSRKRRLARRRRAWVAAGALLVTYLVPWWVLTGRENRVRQQALALAATSLPDPDDPRQRFALPQGRLAAVREQLRNGVGSREEYAALMFAAEDVGFRYPELRHHVQELRNDITAQFNREHGLRPVDLEAEAPNRRIRIEGGSFEMGNPDVQGDPAERPPHRVTVSPFRIQEHEVTNAEYRRFDPNHDRLAPGDYPVVNVSWYDAAAYAAWLGGSLPTEAQWEFAARGVDGRKYPWGDGDPTCAHANSLDCGLTARPVKEGRAEGQTPEQVYDLAGNVWEWCRDWYGDYFSESQKDPLGPTAGSARVVRGGSFANSFNELRGVNRTRSAPEVRDARVGFRVVWPDTAGQD